VTGEVLQDVSRDDFVGMVSNEKFVGDPLVDTQHLVGASRFIQVSENEIQGFHQLRAAHQRYTSPEKKQVEAKGHGHALIRHDYEKIDGKWLLAGLRPTVRWNEYDFGKVFKGH
jgi:scytalone dehydratase